MSHRNNDGSWANTRNSSRNNSDGGGNQYKDRNWSSGGRYNNNNNNNNNNDRRSYRGYGGGGRNDRRNYDDRRAGGGGGNHPYRWSSNSNGRGGGDPDGNYSGRHQQNNWRGGKKSSSEKGHPPQQQQLVPLMQIIPPLIIDFSEPPPPSAESERTAESKGERNQVVEPVATEELPEDESSKYIGEGSNTSPEGFQGFPDVEPLNGDDIDLKTLDEKIEMTPQENELIKLIEDEAMKMITEEPSCSRSSSSQNSSTGGGGTTSATQPATSSQQNQERRATIERSADQVTRKLINSLSSMNKHSLKQMINNPDSKYETALKTHARQKLRAEVRRQLRNFSLSESNPQGKSFCGMLEPDECIDSDKIPDALLEQIGKVLDMNLLDLNVSSDDQTTGTSAPTAVTTATEDDLCVGISQNEVDYSAVEVLDKNLGLTDEDGQIQLDAEDIFARAELLLMKGSESTRQGNSSGPSSPTEEMFPNDQIDSIVSEENGENEKILLEANGIDDEDDVVAQVVSEALAPVFPCFLRVSTVEELNKKVDTLPSPGEVACEPSVAEESVVEEPELIDESTIETPSNLHQKPTELIPLDEVLERIKSMDADLTNGHAVTEVVHEVNDDAAALVVPESNDNDAPSTDLPTANNPEEPELTQLEPEPAQPEPEETSDKPIDDEPPPKSSPVPSAPEVIRAPTHPELAARKSKGSKTYKPNLVLHEQSKRDKSSTPSASPSRSSSRSNNKPVPPPTVEPSKSDSSNSSKHKNSRKRDSNGPSSTNNHLLVVQSPAKVVQTNTTSVVAATAVNDNTTAKSSSSAATAAPTAPSKPTPRPPTPVCTPRMTRAQTPGPKPSPVETVEPANDLTSSKKKKKKRNKRRYRSPDGGMMLECDIRVAAPAVVATPTPPPILPPSRDVTPSKKTFESEREPERKPSRETRSKSVDPKFYFDSREKDKEKDRGKDRSRAKSRGRDVEDRKESDRESRRDKEKDSKADKDKDVKKIKEEENDVVAAVDSPQQTTEGQSTEPGATTKAAARENKKSSSSKHSKQAKEQQPKENCKAKDQEPKEPESKGAPKEKDSNGLAGTAEPVKENETKEAVPAEGAAESTTKTHKKKKSLLRGPDLVKGRKEVVPEVTTEPKNKQPEVVVAQPVENGSADSGLSEQSSASSIVTETPAAVAVRQLPEQPAVAPSLAVLRNPSPRSWKSPGEKKLLPTPTVTPTPMSPPPPRRPSTPVTSPEPSPVSVHRHVHQPQPSEALKTITTTPTTIPLPTHHLVPSHLVIPQVNHFAPVMTLLNQMQEIDNRMSDFQRRKMQIDSEMMKLNSEKFQIDQHSMQLQNDRFLLVNALRAALIECELSALAAAQSSAVAVAAAAAATTTAPDPVLIQSVSRRRHHPEPDPEPAPKSKRRKEVSESVNTTKASPASSNKQPTSLAPDLSEPEEPATPAAGPSGGGGGERTIRKITRISGNTQILKLFQRRRLISDRSAEESQSEDSSTTNNTTTAATATASKRRKTRTATSNERSETPPVDTSHHPPAAAVVAAATPAVIVPMRFKKDAEIPLDASRTVLTREVKIVLSKLDFGGGRS